MSARPLPRLFLALTAALLIPVAAADVESEACITYEDGSNERIFFAGAHVSVDESPSTLPQIVTVDAAIPTVSEFRAEAAQFLNETDGRGEYNGDVAASGSGAGEPQQASLQEARDGDRGRVDCFWD